MLAFRIVLAGATFLLAVPAAAFATNADGATPTATPLLAELAVAAAVVVGLIARRRVAHLARAGWSRLAQSRASRRVARPARISGR
jgi:hypothetical protein